MKSNKKIYTVNKQEDEDLESYILYPENAIIDPNQGKLQHPVVDSIERIKQKAPANEAKELRRL